MYFVIAAQTDLDHVNILNFSKYWIVQLGFILIYLTELRTRADTEKELSALVGVT